MKAFFLFLLFQLGAGAESLLQQDPEVVYTREFAPDGIQMQVEKAAPIYATKRGKRILGNLKPGTQVELLGFNERAYRVRGKRLDGSGVAGWVGPHALSLKELENFKEVFQEVYQRQVLVRELIAAEEVAVGMSVEEVSRSLGKPTKTSSRRTAEGSCQVWEYLEFELIRHYQNVRDPYTGVIYRQFTHSTREVTSRLEVEFVDGFVTAVEESEDHDRRGRARIVSRPFRIHW